MPDGHATWLDLPAHQRTDIVRLGFLSAIAFGYALAMAILAQPIPSRSLHAHVALPHAAAPRSALMEALVIDPAPALRTTVALRTNERPVSGAGVRPAVVMETETAVPQARTARRGNAFSRFFKGVWRTVS